MSLYKRYVDVETLITKEGQYVPLKLYWNQDGAVLKYEIDKIIMIKKSYSIVGGCGILYKCKIQGHVRNLFWEQNRWFIESHTP
ncbi:MAG: hypothetical protein WBO70_01435 [Erysipelotrichaceae bacterium]